MSSAKKQEAGIHEISLFPDLTFCELKQFPVEVKKSSKLKNSIRVSAHQFPIDDGVSGCWVHFVILQTSDGTKRAQFSADYLVASKLAKLSISEEELRLHGNRLIETAVWPMFINLMGSIAAQTSPRIPIPPGNFPSLEVVWRDKLESIRFDAEKE